MIELNAQYNEAVEKEKLNSESEGMKKSLCLLGFEFESSSGRTPQYLKFHRVFKRELTNLLKPHTQKIEISKPNHFDVKGFFQMNDGKIFYFSLGDLRRDKNKILIRSAKNFKDYTGEIYNNINLDENFAENLIKFVTTYRRED